MTKQENDLFPKAWIACRSVLEIKGIKYCVEAMNVTQYQLPKVKERNISVLLRFVNLLNLKLCTLLRLRTTQTLLSLCTICQPCYIYSSSFQVIATIILNICKHIYYLKNWAVKNWVCPGMSWATSIIIKKAVCARVWFKHVLLVVC